MGVSTAGKKKGKKKKQKEINKEELNDLHDAGYDSKITGECFILMNKAVENNFKIGGEDISNKKNKKKKKQIMKKKKKKDLIKNKCK